MCNNRAGVASAVLTPIAYPQPMSDPLLALPAAVSAIDDRRLAQQSGGRGAGPAVPRRVMQYWDHEPPPQITVLLERTAEICRRHGVEHVRFDDRSARELLARHYPGEVLRAYDVAVHPAMKCDVFRLAWLHHAGGHYVDADIVLRPACTPLFEQPGQVLVFQWDSQGLSNLCNWLIGSVPGHPALRAALMATARQVESACRTDPQAALKNILGVSGPGIFTRGIGSWLAAHAGQAEAAGVQVQTVSFAHRVIQLGPQYLKAPLGYKSDERHWLAAAEGGDAPAEAGPHSPAGGWWQRLLRRIGPAGRPGSRS